MGLLRDVVGSAPFVFIAGKGGVGKTTTAGALALDLADSGSAVHLISTDPAHSLADLLPHAVAGRVRSDATPQIGGAALTIEEFDARGYADRWLDHARASLAELIERGTYLDADDVGSFTRLALPGIDELMAVLRLVDLVGTETRVVVDTAPTGHTLRLLDASATHDSLARALRHMADKAVVVASSFAGRTVRLASEALIDELADYARRYREDVLGPAAFVVVTRSETAVVAETSRIITALQVRGLRAVATVWTGAPDDTSVGARSAGTTGPRSDAEAQTPRSACLAVPLLAEPPRGEAALRHWSSLVAPCVPGAAAHSREVWLPHAGAPALTWLCAQPLRLWLLAGKGGVGKTTCAAALALALAADRDVLLCTADPAGSLTDVLDGDVDTALRVRTRQIDAAAEFRRLRALYRVDIMGALESIGLSEAAVLDRRVIESLFDLAPPGIDEVAALVSLLDAASSQETIVLDAAPTGHFLRLLGMPELALDWTRQLMRLIVKYGAAGIAGNAAEGLLRLSRELRALERLLRDGQRTGALIVSLPEPLVVAETERLRAALVAADVPVLATIINRATGQDGANGRTIYAPALPEPPVGVRDLRAFGATWKIVT